MDGDERHVPMVGSYYVLGMIIVGVHFLRNGSRWLRVRLQCALILGYPIVHDFVRVKNAPSVMRAMRERRMRVQLCVSDREYCTTCTAYTRLIRRERTTYMRHKRIDINLSCVRADMSSLRLHQSTKVVCDRTLSNRTERGRCVMGLLMP